MYANPILAWLTQDQHYGEALYSAQDTVLTLEALTEYSKTTSRAVLNQKLQILYSKHGELGQVHLTQRQPVVKPIQVEKNDHVSVVTEEGTGVSNVKMKSVFYETTSSIQSCNFDITIEVVDSDVSESLAKAAHLVACAKYKPPPNEVMTESSLTVMKIQLPTGVEALLEDLRQFKDVDEPLISNYELQGNTVVIQMDTVPSDIFLCIGFRLRIGFTVNGASESLFSVYEPQDRGSMCTKQFSSSQQRLLPFCLGAECQCMAAACPTYRGDMDTTLTEAKRTAETCEPHITYAYKLEVKSSAAEGDFMTYTATVVEVVKIDKQFESVASGTELDLIKKATCKTVDIQNDRQYLVMGAGRSEGSQGSGYRLHLDSEALVELWPTKCTTDGCRDYISHLDDYTIHMQFTGCPPPA